MMPQHTMAGGATKTQERVQQFLETHPGKALTLAEIARGTGSSENELKGTLGQLAKGQNGQSRVQRIGQGVAASYMYSQTPLPSQGQTFTGQVVGFSAISGTPIIRDSSGASWKVEPV